MGRTKLLTLGKCAGVPSSGTSSAATGLCIGADAALKETESSQEISGAYKKAAPANRAVRDLLVLTRVSSRKTRRTVTGRDQDAGLARTLA